MHNIEQQVSKMHNATTQNNKNRKFTNLTFAITKNIYKVGVTTQKIEK